MMMKTNTIYFSQDAIVMTKMIIIQKKHINRIISLTEFAFIHMGTYVRMRASIVS